MRLPTDSRLVPALLIACVIACDRTPAPPAGGTRADTASPIEVADPELTAACDSLERWTRTAGTPTLERHDGQFTGSVRGQQRWGCRITATDSLAPGDAERPLDLLQRTLLTRGWTVEQDFVAESSDGAMIGMRTGTLLCVLQHYWSAHSDDERARQPTDRYAYNLQLECSREAPRNTR